MKSKSIGKKQHLRVHHIKVQLFFKFGSQRKVDKSFKISAFARKKVLRLICDEIRIQSSGNPTLININIHQ